MVRTKNIGYFVFKGQEGFCGYIAADTNYGTADLYRSIDTHPLEEKRAKDQAT